MRISITLWYYFENIYYVIAQCIYACSTRKSRTKRTFFARGNCCVNLLSNLKLNYLSHCAQKLLIEGYISFDASKIFLNNVKNCYLEIIGLLESNLAKLTPIPDSQSAKTIVPSFNADQFISCNSPTPLSEKQQQQPTFTYKKPIKIVNVSFNLKNDIEKKIGKKRKRKKFYKTIRSNENVCTNCRITSTPEWRRGPEGPLSLCNRCGLYWAKHNKLPEIKAHEFNDDETCEEKLESKVSSWLI